MRTTKENIKGVYPLSPMQEGMLHHALADENTPSYMQQVCWTVRGTLDCGLLEKSWNILLARHDGPRTVFVHEGTDRPLQVVVKEAALRVDFQDLRALAEVRREPVRREIMELQRTTPFNLSRDLLMRLLVIRRAGDLYDVCWTHHHLLLDGWSVGILLGEFLHIYSSLKDDRRPELAPPVPVSGYIAWFERQSREISRSFWNERLRGYSRIAEIAPSGLDLSSFKGEQGSVGALLEPELYGALQARAADSGVTIAVILQAIWAVVLSRYNDCDDVVFGLVVSGRPAEVEGIESMVGNLINTVAVRVRIDPGMSWRSLAEKIQEESLLAAPHHHYPLAAAQRESNLPAGLFSTIMAVESYPIDAGVEEAARSGAPGFVLETTAIHERTNYPLDVQFLPTAQGLRCTFFYGRDQYEDGQIEALMRHFTRCAAACAEMFSAAVDEVEMMDRDEVRHLLFDLNAPAAAQPARSDRTVVELFEEQVARTPETIALVCGEASLSYAELNHRANLLAHALIDEFRVVTGDVVGILLPRSAEYIVAILGILKAGAAYLPLDPDIPEQRQADMVRECRARYIILETKLLEGLPFRYRLSEPFIDIETIPRFTPPRPPIADLDTLPIIDRSLIDYEAYNQFIGQSTARFSAAIQATRGCPYKCAYCHKIWPKIHIRRSPEHLFAEIERLSDCGFTRFVFIDDIFNLDRAASRAFFEKVIASNLQCQFFFSNGLRGDILSHDEIDLMVEAGTIQMAFALETARPRLQKLIGKHLHIDRLQDNLAYIAARYPQVILELFTMHGFPTETPEEARTTLDFIKDVRWLHFPYIFILRIFPDTEMAGIARSHGVSDQAIRDSMELGYNELPTTLPFAREVSTRYQMAFLNDYFLDPDRLRQVLPWQMRVMDERSLVLKYDSYLPAEIKTLDDILTVAGMSRADLGDVACIKEEEIRPPDLNRRIARVFAPVRPRQEEGGLRILLLDLSQYFAEEKTLLYDVVEPPLGLASLLTVLNRRFGDRVVGRIAKARIDFEDFDGLRRLLEEFRPDCVGVRTLTFYRNFFHKGVELLRQWGFTGPIIAGGPYATSSTALLLGDANIDAAVIGEGEVTFCEVVETMLARGTDCAATDLFEDIAGMAFIPVEQRRRMRDASCRFLTLERLSAAMEGRPAANPPRKAGPADAIYIIHTSGSTGKPKGVAVEHHSMSNLVGWLKRTVYSRYPAPIREATVAPLIFDVSAQQIFGAFSSGYALYLVPGDIAAAPALLLAYLKEQRVRMVNVTPSRLATMLDAIDQGGEPMTVDQLLVGAEKFPRSMVERFYGHPGHENKHKKIVIRNMYGPTECCVDAASWLFDSDSFRQWLHPPLGRAIDNAYFRILDRAMRPVPVGVFGELYVGGEGVAREYVNRPEESGRCFVADPFAGSGRLYRTGDRVRWTAGGMIEFGGRIDNQLKVRGFRIEPEEIEKWLGRHPAVAAAAVTAFGAEGEAETLAAFVVTRSEVTVEALQDFLRASLPAYMIPSLFATVEELPLGASGKLDRLQLRAMSPANHLRRGAAVETPRSEEERVLEQAWRIVLGEERLSIHDNYFALGGDSIKAIQVVSRLARVGWTVTIRDLFRYPTIGQLAPHIVPAKTPARVATATDRAPLTPIQTAFIENHRIEPNRFNHAMVLKSKERIDLAALQAAWDCVLATHGALRGRFRREPEGWLQELGGDRGRRIELYDSPTGHEEAAERLHGSLDIESGELAAAACIRAGDGDRILLVVHHLAVDGISWRIILAELIECYGKARAGIAPTLDPPPVSFIQWANSLVSHAGDSRFLSQLPYWQAVAQSDESDDPFADVLAGAGENSYGESAVVRFELGRQETDKLRLAAHQPYSTTVEDLLLCALGRALLAEHGIASALITLESHGREETFGLDLGRTCGWLTVTCPFALAIHAERDLAYQIKAVKEALRAVPDRGVGYGILRYLTPKALTRNHDLSCSPAIGFNYLGRLEAGPDDAFKVELDPHQDLAVNGAAARPHVLDVSALVVDDILNVSLSSSRQGYGALAAHRLAEAMRAEILAIIDHCCDGRQTEPTPSDLTYTGLTLDELEGIL